MVDPKSYLSVILPVYNEEGSLKPLYEEMKDVFQRFDHLYEIIFVNDGSTDNTPQILESFHKADPAHVRIITQTQRQGQTQALKSGFGQAQGEYVFTLDADLQNDPQEIGFMLKILKDRDLDCICGWRQARRDTFLKAKLSKLGNILQRLLTGLRVHDVSCTLRGYHRRVLDKIPLNWEGQHRFIPLSLALQKAKIDEVITNHRPRVFGESKYHHKRIFRVMIDFFRVLLTGGRK